MRAAQLAVAAAAALAASAPAGVRAQAPARAAATPEAVFERILAVVPPPPGLAWPPVFKVEEQREVNAYAYQKAQESGPPQPHVRVTTGLLEALAKGRPEALSAIVGHEIGHVVLGHTGRDRDGQTEFTRISITREQEFAADRFGVEAALRAGFAFKDARDGLRYIRELGEYSPEVALAVDHPAWSERLARIDQAQEALWRQMGAFASGVTFLRAEQYPEAARCFRAVTKAFPDAWEAWANYGYALLMQYADGLEPEDLRRLDVGPILVGAFYERAGSLEGKVRGVDEETWWEAVGALREALKLQPGSALAAANLGVAYLVRPAGKDVAKATELLERAQALAAADAALDPIARAAVSLNLAVALGDAPDRAADREKALALAAAAAKDGRGARTLGPAIAYARALSLAGGGGADGKRAAMSQLETYLRGAPAGSPFWRVAYERYSALAQATGSAAKPAGSLQAAAAELRPVSSAVVDGVRIGLGDPLKEVQARLGPGVAVPVVPQTNLVRYVYPARGLELVATDRVLAVVMTRPGATLTLQGRGTGGATQELKIGMAKDALDRAVATEPAYGPIVDPEKVYRFYPAYGLVLKVKDGVVVELGFARAPASGPT